MGDTGTYGVTYRYLPSTFVPYLRDICFAEGYGAKESNCLDGRTVQRVSGLVEAQQPCRAVGPPHEEALLYTKKEEKKGFIN